VRRKAREARIGQIRAVLLSQDAPDRTHALEALAKLQAPIASDAERAIVKELAKVNSVAPFAYWRLAQEGDVSATGDLTRLLGSIDATTVARTASVLGALRPLPDTTVAALKAALAIAPTGSPAIAPLMVASGDPALRTLAHSSKIPGVRYTLAMELAENGIVDDRDILQAILRDADEDVRVAAAYGVLNLSAEKPAEK
jgi:HEAT repeat protein